MAIVTGMIKKTMHDKTGFYCKCIFIIMGNDIKVATGYMAEMMVDIVIFFFEVYAVEAKVISLCIANDGWPCRVKAFYIGD